MAEVFPSALRRRGGPQHADPPLRPPDQTRTPLVRPLPLGRCASRSRIISPLAPPGRELDHRGPRLPRRKPRLPRRPPWSRSASTCGGGHWLAEVLLDDLTTPGESVLQLLDRQVAIPAAPAGPSATSGTGRSRPPARARRGRCHFLACRSRGSRRRRCPCSRWWMPVRRSGCGRAGRRTTYRSGSWSGLLADLTQIQRLAPVHGECLCR